MMAPSVSHSYSFFNPQTCVRNASLSVTEESRNDNTPLRDIVTSLESTNNMTNASTQLTSSSPRTSQRFSMISVATTSSTTTINAELAQITENLQKLENKKLQSQRFVPTKDKTDLLSTLALGAKLERALDRRMGGQDAVMRVKTKEEKAA